MTTKSASYEVINGPSREELFDGLRLRHEKREVSFTLGQSENYINISFLICGIATADFVDDCWNIRCHAKQSDLSRLDVWIHYSTKSRKGILVTGKNRVIHGHLFLWNDPPNGVHGGHWVSAEEPKIKVYPPPDASWQLIGDTSGYCHNGKFRGEIVEERIFSAAASCLDALGREKRKQKR